MIGKTFIVQVIHSRTHTYARSFFYVFVVFPEHIQFNFYYSVQWNCCGTINCSVIDLKLIYFMFFIIQLPNYFWIKKIECCSWEYWDRDKKRIQESLIHYNINNNNNQKKGNTQNVVAEKFSISIQIIVMLSFEWIEK